MNKPDEHLASTPPTLHPQPSISAILQSSLPSASSSNFQPQRPTTQQSSYFDNSNAFLPRTQTLSPAPSHATHKHITHNGRAKVNTLPPWAKSFDDDDDLFDSTASQCPSNSAPTLVSPSGSRFSSRSKKSSKPSRPSLSTTLVPDSPPLPRPPASPTASSSSSSSMNFPSDLTPPRKSRKSHRLKSHARRVTSAARPHLTRKGKENRPVRESARANDLELGEMTKGVRPLRRTLSQEITSPRRTDTQIEALSLAETSGRMSTGGGRYGARHSMATPITISPVIQRFKSYSAQKRRRVAEEAEAAPSPPDSDPGSGSHHGPDDRWWQFTLPTKYRKKVGDYIQRGGQSIGGVSHWNALAPSASPREMVEARSDLEIGTEMPRGYMDVDPSYSAHQAHTPTWNTPWQPFVRRSGSMGPGQPFADHFSDYRPHQGDFPISAFSRKMSMTYNQQQQLLQQAGSVSQFGQVEHVPVPAPPPATRKGLKRVIYYLLNHPTAPLAFRVLNFAFITAALGLSVKIRRVEISIGAVELFGNSTIYIIVIAPFSMLHILFAIYCEYFGAPIGIWSVSWKMFHTLSELVSISLWSSALALAFDNIFTTVLGCTAPTPGARMLADVEGFGAVFEVREEMCELQAGLVCMILMGLFLYTVVLVVSLFRIFNKVSRKS